MSQGCEKCGCKIDEFFYLISKRIKIICSRCARGHPYAQKHYQFIESIPLIIEDVWRVRYQDLSNLRAMACKLDLVVSVSKLIIDLDHVKDQINTHQMMLDRCVLPPHTMIKLPYSLRDYMNRLMLHRITVTISRRLLVVARIYDIPIPLQVNNIGVKMTENELIEDYESMLHQEEKSGGSTIGARRLLADLLFKLREDKFFIRSLKHVTH